MEAAPAIADRHGMQSHTYPLLDANHPLFLDALRLILCGTTVSTPQTDVYVNNLLQVALDHDLGIDLLPAVIIEDQIVSAVLAVESPGNAAMVYAPPGKLTHRRRNATIDLLKQLQQQAWGKGVAVLQTLLWPQEEVRPECFAESGFDHLAELIYMDRPANQSIRNFRCDVELRVETYSPERHDDFIKALDESYVDSLDCPRLLGLRSTEDTLVGHRASGIYDPEGWYVAMVGNEPAGVLLTSRVFSRSAVEVVYMGVCSSHRGQQVGNRLMAIAVERAKAMNVDAVTLAVDAANEPARRLYHRWGFIEQHRRDAWIATRNGTRAPVL